MIGTSEKSLVPNSARAEAREVHLLGAGEIAARLALKPPRKCCAAKKAAVRQDEGANGLVWRCRRLANQNLVRVLASKRGEVLLMQRMGEMAKAAMLSTPDKKFEEDSRSGLQPKYLKTMKELFSGVATPRRCKPFLLI